MNYTILVAEDNKDIVELLKLYLETSGYHVLIAYDGMTAFETIKNEKIDLIIMDIMMPRMDGYELTKEVRKIKNIPILILSAKNQDSDKILGLNLGADDYITKPFNPLEVTARVEANLRRFYRLNDNHKDHQQTILQLGDLILDTASLTLKKEGKRLLPLQMSIKFFCF